MTELIVSDKGRAQSDLADLRTKDRLLLLLKTRGSLTTKALAAALGISVPATRTHLNSLGDSVVARNVAAGVGRPAQTWQLTEEAHGRFPDTHSELTVRILASIERALGAQGLDAVIEDRYQESERAYLAALSDLSSLKGRLRRLAQLRTDEGYMADFQKTSDGWLLLENHCPICAAASACQGLCRNELKLFQKVLGPDVVVERSEYLLEGGRRCAYTIKEIKEIKENKERARASGNT